VKAAILLGMQDQLLRFPQISPKLNETTLSPDQTYSELDEDFYQCGKCHMPDAAKHM
jgi:hypothetical protein